jgi:hypothetical protein
MPRPYRKSLLSFLLPRLGRDPDPPRQPAKPSTPMFQGVSIQHGPKVCAMAKQIGDRRFLARKAPALPLTGCSMQGECRCRYVKHSDRRLDGRRLTDIGVSTAFFDGAERRAKRGRRKTD